MNPEIMGQEWKCSKLQKSFKNLTKILFKKDWNKVIVHNNYNNYILIINWIMSIIIKISLEKSKSMVAAWQQQYNHYSFHCFFLGWISNKAFISGSSKNLVTIVHMCNLLNIFCCQYSVSKYPNIHAIA